MNPHHEKNLNEIPRLSRIIGQLQGLKKKIEDGHHCNELVHLTRSASKALESFEAKIIEYHVDEKVSELSSLKRSDISSKKEIVEELLKIFKGKSF